MANYPGRYETLHRSSIPNGDLKTAGSDVRIAAYPKSEEHIHMNKMITDEIVTKENAAAVKSRLVEEAALASGQHWLAISFASTAAAVAWLNADPIQSPGEVAATARNDGSVAMLTIMPPSDPLNPSHQKWVFQNFPNQAAAVTFLNENGQGDGEASATLRNDSSVGVFYITPAVG
ncbi:MAG: hypothetical protein JO122_12215 [Acetobacteraceae bacterium]|nr:hypothetical protein [Acetobacteraceae bacterium]